MLLKAHEQHAPFFSGFASNSSFRIDLVTSSSFALGYILTLFLYDIQYILEIMLNHLVLIDVKLHHLEFPEKTL